MSVAGGGNATSVNHNNTLNNEYLYIVIALRRVTGSCLPSSISNKLIIIITIIDVSIYYIACITMGHEGNDN